MTAARGAVERWTMEDDRAVRSLYPDYHVLKSRLPNRTPSAIKHRAKALGVAKKRHVWTQLEVARLKRLWTKGKPLAEIMLSFPFMTEEQVKGQAQHLKLHRERKAPITLNIPVLDAIRQRAHREGMTMVELDLVAGTKRYFQACPTRVDWPKLAKATLALGGHLMPLWDEDDPENLPAVAHC